MGPSRRARIASSAVSLALAWSTAAHAEPILVTIDDLPLIAAEYFTRDEQIAMIGRVLDALDAHGVQAITFANGDKIQPHHERVLDEVVRRGHALGSHTYSHPSLNRSSVESFREDILRNEASLEPWMTTPRYFRFPYLETGATRDARDEIAALLLERGYRNVPVTVDSDDWSYNTRYTRAIKAGDEAEAGEIAEEYLRFVIESAARARSLAREKLGREIHHVLLLHLNHLNSVVLDRLLTQLENEGWTFGKIDETLDDPVYALEDEYFGPLGLTWLDRVLR